MKDNRIALMGAICGDIIGSSYEFHSTKKYDFQLFTRNSTFTDDSIMTCANAKWLMTGGELSEIMRNWGKRYISSGYGPMFYSWLRSPNPQPYNSFGNGSGMRVSPVGWYAQTLEECLKLAKESAEVTHNHPEGIKGAQAISSGIFLARAGATKEIIKDYIQESFGYNLDRKIADIRPEYRFDETCQGSVSESIICFLESNDYESAVRLAVSLGGDADTMACMAGSIAAAFYREIPDKIAGPSLELLSEDIYNVVVEFSEFIKDRSIKIEIY